MTSHRIITLTTDFGLSDAYVGVMKGVILGIAPEVTLVDISHEVHPLNVAGAAYLLQMAYPYFPADAIHLAVVDPGVGTDRKPLAIAAPHGLFVGPDNGIFCRALADQAALDAQTGELLRGTAVALENREFWRQPVSQTFHGRDIFAPAAAHLALGTRLTALGPAQSVLERAPTQAPIRQGEAVYGSIVHIDRFGNAISNVPEADIPEPTIVEVAGRELHGLASSYQDGRLVAIVGSGGMLEIAARNASAASALGLQVGDPIVVRKATS